MINSRWPQTYLADNINVHHLFMCKSDFHQTRIIVLIWSVARARVLFDLVGGLILTSDDPFGFRTEMELAEALNNFGCHHIQNDFYHKNNLNQTFEVLLFYLALLLIFLCCYYC